jgi:hypothetical protein
MGEARRESGKLGVTRAAGEAKLMYGGGEAMERARRYDTVPRRGDMVRREREAATAASTAAATGAGLLREVPHVGGEAKQGLWADRMSRGPRASGGGQAWGEPGGVTGGRGREAAWQCEVALARRGHGLGSAGRPGGADWQREVVPAKCMPPEEHQAEVAGEGADGWER